MPRSLPLLICSAALLGAAPAAFAGPLRVTVLDCGLVADCSAGVSRITAFDTETPLSVAAPAPMTRHVIELSVPQVLAGSFAGVELVGFNVAGNIGSNFHFNDLVGEDGTIYSSLVLVGPWTSTALRLDWGVGSYLGLGRATCLNAACTASTPIQSFLRVDIGNVPVASVPTPASAALVLGALGAAALAGGRRSRRRAAAAPAGA